MWRRKVAVHSMTGVEWIRGGKGQTNTVWTRMEIVSGLRVDDPGLGKKRRLAWVMGIALETHVLVINRAVMAHLSSRIICSITGGGPKLCIIIRENRLWVKERRRLTTSTRSRTRPLKLEFDSKSIHRHAQQVYARSGRALEFRESQGSGPCFSGPASCLRCEAMRALHGPF